MCGVMSLGGVTPSLASPPPPLLAALVPSFQPPRPLPPSFLSFPPPTLPWKKMRSGFFSCHTASMTPLRLSLPCGRGRARCGQLRRAGWRGRRSGGMAGGWPASGLVQCSSTAGQPGSGRSRRGGEARRGHPPPAAPPQSWASGRSRSWAGRRCLRGTGARLGSRPSPLSAQRCTAQGARDVAPAPRR